MAFIENGRSYAPKSVLDQAYAALAQQAGVKRADEAYNLLERQLCIQVGKRVGGTA